MKNSTLLAITCLLGTTYSFSQASPPNTIINYQAINCSLQRQITAKTKVAYTCAIALSHTPPFFHDTRRAACHHTTVSELAIMLKETML